MSKEPFSDDENEEPPIEDKPLNSKRKPRFNK